MTMLDNEQAWAEERAQYEPDEGDRIEATAAEIGDVIGQWRGDAIRPWALTTLLDAVASAVDMSGLGFEDLQAVANEPVHERLTELALQSLAARSDDMGLIDRLSRALSDAEGQLIYNMVVTLTRMQRHRANLTGLRRAD